MDSLRGIRRVSLRRRGAEARHGCRWAKVLMMWNVEDVGATVGNSVSEHVSSPYASRPPCEE